MDEDIRKLKNKAKEYDYKFTVLERTEIKKKPRERYHM